MVKQLHVVFFLIIILLCSCHIAKSIINEKIINQCNYDYNDEIIFITLGTSFSPKIIVEGDAEILWIWDDETTSHSDHPEKNYGSTDVRINRLKVVPWSALSRINIGYTGEDGGDYNVHLHKDIEQIQYVENQHVYSVQNLELAAPYLKQWCSSYNPIYELDFSNFVKLDTIECFNSTSLEEIKLDNTPSLRRLCVEHCKLSRLDLSQSPGLEDLRFARQAIQGEVSLNFGSTGQKIWHICIHTNRLNEQTLFDGSKQYPNLVDLYLHKANQTGDLIISQTGDKQDVVISVNSNNYRSADFRGALQNRKRPGRVVINDNILENINLQGCIQLTKLEVNNNNLSNLDISDCPALVFLSAENNRLSSDEVTDILKTLDDFELTEGSISLTGNAKPSEIGMQYVDHLIQKGWIVRTD
ncbi:MAG: hypothetical protein JXR70_11845 [Spirochaetales bacterium]|nr:hypothetical protein [Spirochaetales bacterium]